LTNVESTYPDVARYNELHALLRRPIDAVIVAAPAPLHAEIACAALRAGKHVFVEKPLALCREDALAILRAGQEAQRHVFVGHVVLYHPGVRALLDQVRAGTIGEVRHVRSRRLSFGTIRPHENVWWSFAPHDVALVLEILGEMPEAARGSLWSFVRPQIADFAYADLAFSGGRSAHIEVSWLDPDKAVRLDVFGSKGTLTFADGPGGGSVKLIASSVALNGAAAAEHRQDAARAIPFAAAEPLEVEMRAFLRLISEGTPAPTGGAEGLRVVEVLAMLDRSRSPSLEAIA
jgi:predicted dehydrogenase